MTARTLLATFPGFGPSRRWAWVDIARAWRVIATRRDLAEADARMLRDIGLTRADALLEQRRAPWDIAPRRPYRREPERGGRGFALRGWIAEAWRRHRSRRLLAQFDAAGLRDIGLTFADAEAEANKPFWRS